MKNKFLLFLLCQCLFALAYAQGTNTKPTKEETIKWIIEKIYANRTPAFSEMYYANGILTYKAPYFDRELNLNAVTSIDTGFVADGVTLVNSDEKSEIKGDKRYIRRLVLKGSGLIKKYYFSKGVKYYGDAVNSVNLLAAKAYNASDADCISDMFLIEGLYDRMIKALKVLIEYNTAPAKDEKF